jgi:glycosyltransferase involved in cell wall biosynthesis
VTAQDAKTSTFSGGPAVAPLVPTRCDGQQKGAPRTLVISPVRNEAEYLQRTIDTVAAQTVRPTVWLIVDDGSTDATAEIAARAAAQHNWIRLYRRPDRGVRKVGGGVVEAFDDGLSQYSLDDFDYVCKLDGDLELPPRYFELLYEKFETDPRLGTASGKCWLVTPHGQKPERTGDDFSLGAAKLYRRECFQQIGGFVREVMWDGIDCHRCRMLGWRAGSFHDEGLRIRHLRQMGSSLRSIYHGRIRWGRGQYFMGTHPLYALAIASYRAFQRPWVIGGLLILAGYLGGYLRRPPRYEDPGFRRFLRRWQLRRLGLIRDRSQPPGSSGLVSA